MKKLRKFLMQTPFNKIHAYNKLKKFKGNNGYLNIVFGSIDVLATIISFFIAYLIRDNFFAHSVTYTNQYIILGILILPTWLLILKTTNLAVIPRTSRYLTIFFNFARFSLVGFLIILFYTFIFRLTEVSTGLIFLFSVINMVILYSIRIATFKLFKYYRANGHNLHNILIIADAFSETFIEKIIDQKEWGFRILMIMSDSKLIKAKFGDKIRVIPERANIKSLIDHDIVDEVVYSKNRINHSKIQSIIKTCEEIGVIFRMQNDLSPLTAPHAHLTYFEEVPLITFMNTPSNSLALAWKSILDLLLSSAILIVLSPFLLIVSVLIKMDSKGPVIFKQERVGLRGRKFYIYKFRTMVVNAEEIRKQLESQNESDGPVFKIKNDPRITKMGRILRKTGLDELPQLYNVVKGEMSLIGPRPPLQKEVEEYERWQLRRLSIKPGITCTWQIIPNRNDVLFENWMKLDLHYIDNWSLKLDFKLLIKTIKTVLLGTGA